MWEVLEKTAKDNGLVTAFAFVGVVVLCSGFLSRRLTFGRVHGSAIAIDIIKSGGYKLSALEIEAALLDHPDIRECAVVGVPDDTWGEAVSAVAVLRDGATLELPALRERCKERLSVYKMPQRLLSVGELPRNAMGKVTKPELRGLFPSA